MPRQKQSLSPEETFSNFLQRSHKRRTAERFAVLDYAMRWPGHFSAKNLSDAMHQNGFPVSVTTVYSTIELMAECGLVLRHRFNGNMTLYEKASQAGGQPGHHHLICTSCGKIKEVRDPELNSLIDNKRFQAFTVTHFSLNIYGECSACARKKRRAKLKTN